MTQSRRILQDRKRGLTGLVALGMVCGLLSAGFAPDAVAEDTARPAPVDPQVTVIAEGLDHAWGLAFLPDGEMLVTELSGSLRRVQDGELLPQPVSGVPPVLFKGQGGLMDIVVHPDFADNRLIYLSLSHTEEGRNATRVVRARYEDGALTDVVPVYTGDLLDAPPVHYGGRMAFLPDGTLLITNGEKFNLRERAQDLSTTLGKVVRIADTGGAPADNPFVDRDDAREVIWSYGHRNPQGIVYDPVADRVYAHEHGPRGGDEINIIEPGSNYGWPAATHGIDYSGAIISPHKSLPGMVDGIVVWVPSIAPAGLAQCRGCLWPEWEGDLLTAALAGMQVRRVEMSESGAVVGQETLFTDAGERFRDVRFGPDGAMYLLTDGEDGQIWRVTPRE